MGSGFEQFDQELKAESKGVWHSEFREKQAAKAASLMEGDGEATPEPKKKLTPEEEEIANAKAMMSKKHKRLLQLIEKGKQQKKDTADKLLKKRKQFEKVAQ